MFRLQKSDFSSVLNDIALSLDISDTLFLDAEKKYQAVGKWLGEENSPLVDYAPEIYPQGSFLLGTVIKPVSDADEYDIDLVFRLSISKENITQEKLKEVVGDRLKSNSLYNRMLDEEGSRCWTLKYAESAQFHMDILPAIPDDYYSAYLQEQGVSQSFATTSINITDNTNSTYRMITNDWPKSNPKGFASWFLTRMQTRYDEIRKQIGGMEYRAEIEKVPNFRIKTPLQRAIQLFKRHRDITFADDKKNKPASILITTLAANAYQNEADILDTIINLAEKMPAFITERNGISWIQNPIDPDENFADRWKENPERETNFKNWLIKIKSDLNKLIVNSDIDDAEMVLNTLFGERVAKSSISNHKQKAKSNIVIPNVPTVVDIKKPDKPWGE